MRRIVIAVAVVLFFAVLFSLSPALSSLIKINLLQFLGPAQELENLLFSPIGFVVRSVGRTIEAVRVNPDLEERAGFLSAEVSRLREVEEENRQLRALLDLPDSPRYRGVVARVIGRDIRHWNQSILINRGGADGVKREAAVVSARGLVGKVIEVAPRLSRVLLIIDSASGVGGAIQSSRQTGIVEGTAAGGCLMKYLPRRIEISPGENVVTSGLGGVYPPGLLVGTITAVRAEKEGIYQNADLEPAVRFDRLEWVMVLR